ncbi:MULTISPECIES: SpoIIE family protein phosphatase [unclassified Streptomyces]|uniref:SpoIIE family protein phosphatase n=1 Tax=unclassified Streptomyces TaxID=2593676 RepID=UPI0034017E17
MFRQRRTSVERIQCEAQLPLDMFEETRYHTEQFSLDPGDRLVIVSSGVHAVPRADQGADTSVLGERALRADPGSELSAPCPWRQPPPWRR